MLIISYITFVLSIISIFGSIAIWNFTKGDNAEKNAHAERFGIFVGLWAPTFLGVSLFFMLLSQSS
jgi:hypothetical protein|tara:strand:+ start:344 stop:541 length:198 start_codon:yes stop_codon:yes gene_type:complete